MIATLRVLSFLGFAAWTAVGVTLCFNHEAVKSSSVVFGVIGIEVALFGVLVQAMQADRKRKVEALPIKGIGEWRKEAGK